MAQGNHERPRVAMDCRGLGWGGLERHIKGLAHHLPLEAPEFEFVWVCTEDQMHEIPLNGGSSHLVVRSPLVSVLEQIELPLALIRNKIDLFHALEMNSIPMVAPRLVVTCHDLTQLRYREVMWKKIERAYYRLMINVSIRRAPKLIACSDFVRDDMLVEWPWAGDKVHTILEAAADHFGPIEDAERLRDVKERYQLPDSFMFYLGSRKPHKNLPRLLEAYALLPEETRRENALVLIASPDPRWPQADEVIRRTGIEDDVILLTGKRSARAPGGDGQAAYYSGEGGAVPDADVEVLYALAKFMVIPSYTEGFGLPLVESMAIGTPVLAGRAGAMPEVGLDAVHYVDPLDVDDIRRGLQEMIDSPELLAELSAKGLARAADFSWAKTARNTAEIYRQALAALGRS